MSIRSENVAFEAAMNELGRRNSLFNLWFGATAVVLLASIGVSLAVTAIGALGG